MQVLEHACQVRMQSVYNAFIFVLFGTAYGKLVACLYWFIS
jgi:hypothetical protein